MFPSCIQTDDADIVVVGGVFALWLQLQPSVVSKPLFRTGQIHHDTPGIWWSIACQNAQRSHQIRSFVSQQKGADAFKHACFRLGRQPSNVSWWIEVIEPHEPTAATVNQYWDRICGFQNYLFWLFTCVEIVFAMYGTRFFLSIIRGNSGRFAWPWGILPKNRFLLKLQNCCLPSEFPDFVLIKV